MKKGYCLETIGSNISSTSQPYYYRPKNQVERNMSFAEKTEQFGFLRKRYYKDSNRRNMC